VSVLAHIASRYRLQVGSGDHQAGLPEQLGRPHCQQPLIAGARPDERDPSGRRLLLGFGCSVHGCSLPL
jgi:hypothetical protein